MRTHTLLSCSLLAICISALQAQQIQPQLQYQSPRQGSHLVSRATTIAIRPGATLDEDIVNRSIVSAHGSISGHHRGRTDLSDDRRTIIFTPDSPFAPGEEVVVRIMGGLRDAHDDVIGPQSFNFSVSGTSDQVRNDPALIDRIRQADGESLVPSPAGKRTDRRLASGLPADFPAFKVTQYTNPSQGNLYLSSVSFDATPKAGNYLMIVDNSASPIFYRKMPDVCYDFKKQPNGRLTYYDNLAKKFYALDSSYAIVDSFSCGNGYTTDVHELLLLPNGHALILGLEPETVDMRQYVNKGKPTATVLGAIIQELDASKNVVFEWRSFDHFLITDATHEIMTAASIDYVHPNALEVDYDGNILLSSRHMDEITKINRSTGGMIWRLGGKHNEFTFTNDTIGFSHQHFARRLSNGNILLYDNGNYHSPAFSRAVEYRLDESSKTATLVWQYRHTPTIASPSMGSAQRLPNGNTLIGWGSYSTITEVDSSGKIVLEIQFPSGVFSYRAFRYDGPSATIPNLIIPYDGQRDLSHQVQFYWSTVLNTSMYRFQIARDVNFTNVVVDDSTSTGSRQVNGLADNMLYYWRVRALGDTSRKWSTIWKFHTALAQIALQTPRNDSSELPLDPVLTWKGVDGADYYHIQASDDSAFTNLIVNDSSNFNTTYSLTQLSYATRYFWRVRGIGIEASGPWSDAWSFTTVALPEFQHLRAPENGETGISMPTKLEWVPFTGASSYQVQCARWTPDFSDLAVDSTLTQTSVALYNLDSNTTYFWRVRPIVEGVNWYWSESWYFQTERSFNRKDLRVSLLLPPANASVTPDTVNFRWERVGADFAGSDALHFRLQVAPDSVFSRTLIDTSMVDTTIRITDIHLSPGRYWWRIGIANNAGEQIFGAPRSFVMQASGVTTGSNVTGALMLFEPSPNPFGSTAEIRFHIPMRSSVRLRLIDMQGRTVRTLLDDAPMNGGIL